MRRDYSLFGLKVRSELELPELFAAEHASSPDVTIAIGKVPGSKREAGLHAFDGSLTLVIPDVATFRVQDGAFITVEPLSGVPERNIRLYLLGSAFGAVLHQRGLLPLHANAIEIDSRAVAFMGHSGAGKSTLAAWFHDRGHRIIADDVCVVQVNGDGRPRAAPGLPRLRLWLEVLEATGRTSDHYHRSYVGDEQFEKFDVPVSPEVSVDEHLEFAAIYVLEEGDRFAIEPLTGVEAADAVFANTYRGSYVAAAEGQLEHWKACMRLVREVPILRLQRPWGLDRLNEDCKQLLQMLTTSPFQKQLSSGGRR